MIIRKLLPQLCILAGLIAVITGPVLAQNAVPMLTNYQGELRLPTAREPVRDGNYDMAFRIYDIASGGTPLWIGTYSVANGNPVNVKEGNFSVILGSGKDNTLDASIFNEPNRWLEIGVIDLCV